MPVNTAWAVGGRLHPSGTVVTALGNVVVVDVVVVEVLVDDVLVVLEPSVDPGTEVDGTVVSAVTDEVPEASDTTSASAPNAPHNLPCTAGTLVTAVAVGWSHGIRPDQTQGASTHGHRVRRRGDHGGGGAGGVGLPGLTMPGDIWDGTLYGEIEVRTVQPYQALKNYVCPGCNRDIAPGTGHIVTVPRDAPDLRRHWHRGCWQRRSSR